MANSNSPIRFYVVGGFLGSGKTTALTALSSHFSHQGKRTAIITNDQSEGLVDSEVVSTSGIDYREISGTCFCSRFNDFLLAADSLLQEHQPDIILAEPIGSAAALTASVLAPLKAYTQDRYKIMPLTVLADPLRLDEMLQDDHPEAQLEWTDDIRYLYSYQLEEAELILITKSDLVSQETLDRAKQLLWERYAQHRPLPRIQTLSAATGQGIDEWLKTLESLDSGEESKLMPFDRERHARAEATLGWLNLEAHLSAESSSEISNVDLTAVVRGFFPLLMDSLNGVRLGHLKIFASSPDGSLKANMIDPRHSFTLETMNPANPPVKTKENQATILINLRAAADPKFLFDQTTTALKKVAQLQNIGMRIVRHEAKRPSSPTPNWRFK